MIESLKKKVENEGRHWAEEDKGLSAMAYEV